MTPCPHTQLESVIDEVLKTQDVNPLDSLLQKDLSEMTPVKCSQQFLAKLHKLIIRGLDKKDCISARLGLTVLHKCGKILKLGDRQGLPEMIAQGLHKKWFERCKQLWIQCGPKWDEDLLNLSEDFFDALMVVHDSCKNGTYDIAESLLCEIAHLSVHPNTYILIRKEAIQKFNLILDRIPLELKKKLKMSMEASGVMVKLAFHILDCGDHDFQTALTEALCRIMSPDQRKGAADRLFPMEHVASAFVKLRDSEFETECRKFLNLVNGMQGNTRSAKSLANHLNVCSIRLFLKSERKEKYLLLPPFTYSSLCPPGRVFSYPCLEVYLDNNELLMPADEKLEEFWIDFNTGSQGISFYFSLVDAAVQNDQWETLCITVNDVQSYSVTDENKRYILRLTLSEVVVVGGAEGSSLTIYFSSSLDIPQAASKVFGLNKNKAFVGKTSSSVAETPIEVLVGNGSSQVVPESQVPLSQIEKENTVPAPSAPAQKVTSNKRKLSESSFFIQCSAAGSESAHYVSIVAPTSSSKGKPSLEMVRSNTEFPEQQRKFKTCTGYATPNGTLTGATLKQSVSVVHFQNIKHLKPVAVGREDSMEPGFVPDTQPQGERSISSNKNKLSVSEMLMMPTQKISYLPKSVTPKQDDTGITQCPQQRTQDSAHLEPNTLQKKKSDMKEDFRNPKTNYQASKEQQVKRNDKGKEKHQISPQTDKRPVKHSATKEQQQRVSPSVKADSGNSISSKEKKDAELAGSLVKLISRRSKATANESSENVPEASHHLPNRPVFSMSRFSISKKDVSGSESLMKVRGKTTANNTRQRKDVFTFDTGESLSTEEKCKSFKNISTTSSLGINNSTFQSVSAKKSGQPVAKGNRRVKKHLFSDTDTDFVTSEVSWLTGSSKKTKPKVTKYSRQAAVKSKPLSSHSIESSDLSLSSPKSVKDIVKINKEKKVVGKPAMSRSQRPRRAAATTTKTYKEPETDDSQSESEVVLLDNSEKTQVNQAIKKPSFNPQPTKQHFTRCSKPKPTLSFSPKQRKKEQLSLAVQVKKKRIDSTSEQSSITCRKKDSSTNSGLNSRNVKMNALRDSWAACQDSSCASPPFIENMRSAERSAPNTGLPCPNLLALQASLLSASPDPPQPNTPSPTPLLPDPHSSVSSKRKPKAPYICSAGKNHYSPKTRSVQSVSSPLSLISTGPNGAEVVVIHQNSPAPSPLLSVPLLTSTFSEMHNPSVPLPPQSPIPGHTSDSSHYVFSGVSLVSPVSLCTVSTESEPEFTRRRVKCSSSAVWAGEKERSPPLEKHLTPAEQFMSGPRLKRRSHFEENEEKKRTRTGAQSSFRMKPRKLFTSFSKVSGQSTASHVTSSNGVSCNWDLDEGDMDTDKEMEVPKAVLNSSELRKKFENRHVMTEVHNKQSLTAVQQHLTSLNTQLNKYRTGRLEKVLEVLLGEIDKLEEDETLLKTMEKDMTTYWKKQSVAFSSYQQQERKRTESLKKALQSNISPSLDYEESLFTSQMCLIRRDMRTVQDRLLTQMHEGEIQTVRRSLHALFFP